MTELDASTQGDVLETLPTTAWGAPLGEPSLGRAVDALERGSVLVMPSLSFALKEDEKSLLTPDVLDTGSKNVSFDPTDRSCRGTQLQGADKDRLGAMLERFGRAAEALVQAFAPSYAHGLVRARTSFRPAEIGGRASSVRKNDRLLHVDAFPTRPTHGARILRVFSNIAPDGAERRWQVGEPFSSFVDAFFPRIKAGSATTSWMLERLRLTRGRRTAYDWLMLELHDAVKEDTQYQTSAPRTQVTFRPGTSWVVYTDQVLHAALSGRFALEQTFHLPVASMVRPDLAPLSVLEHLAGRRLV